MSREKAGGLKLVDKWWVGTLGTVPLRTQRI